MAALVQRDFFGVCACKTPDAAPLKSDQRLRCDVLGRDKLGQGRRMEEDSGRGGGAQTLTLIERDWQKSGRRVARSTGWREEGRECTRPRSARVPPSSGPPTVGSSAAMSNNSAEKGKNQRAPPPKEEEI